MFRSSSTWKYTERASTPPLRCASWGAETWAPCPHASSERTVRRLPASASAPGRSAGGRVAQGAAGERSPVCLYEVRTGLGREGSDGRPPPDPASPVDSPRMRRVASPARGRTDRPLPLPLARRDWHAGRRLVGRDGPARGGGEGALGWRVEFRRAAPGALREDPSRGIAPASLLDDQPPGLGGGDPLVRRARDGRDHLQPDAVGSPDGEVDRRSGEDPCCG